MLMHADVEDGSVFESYVNAWSDSAPPTDFAPEPRSMWRGMVVQRDRVLGTKEAIAMGPDGFVWSYTLDAATGRSGRLMSTGLLATCFTPGKAPDGRTVVIAADGVVLGYSVSAKPGEGGPDEQRWSPPNSVDFPGASRSLEVERILTHTRGGTLMVAVIAREPCGSGKARYVSWDAVWLEGGLVFGNTPTPLPELTGFWLEELIAKPR